MARVTVDDAEIYFEEVGRGRPLVLLHGLSGSGLWWRRNVPVLAGHFRVYIVDLIGFGASRGQPFLLHRAADLLVKWLETLALKEASFVGHSLGGFIATDLTINHPGRVAQLVLVDAATLPIGRPLMRHGLDLVHALRYMSLDFLPVLLQDAWRAGPRTLLSAMREIRQADLAGHLAEVTVPTLVIWGENDTLIDPLIGRELAASLPRAELVMIPEAGHNPMWDRPHRFNEVLLEFLGNGE